jgi:hypothetical protein
MAISFLRILQSEFQKTKNSWGLRLFFWWQVLSCFREKTLPDRNQRHSKSDHSTNQQLI